MLHKGLGYLVLVFMAWMVMGGLLMSPFPVCDTFPIFNVFFALPWIVWIVELIRSGASRAIVYHRIMGNLAVKGCVAVPLARILSAALQSLQGPTEAEAYYGGIGLSSLIIACWAVFDLYHMRDDIRKARSE